MTDAELKAMTINILYKYKELSYLWNKKDPTHKNMYKRNQGFAIIHGLFKTIDPSITIKGSKKKMENMLYNYRKEVKKVTAAKKAGLQYAPTLWYYDALSFLPANSEQQLCLRITKKEGSPILSFEEDTSRQSTSSETSAASLRIVTKEEPVWTTEEAIEQENVIDSAEDKPAMMEMEWEIYGKAIGLQLKDLNPRSLAICQKLISDAIYYAKIGRLNEDSYIGLTE